MSPAATYFAFTSRTFDPGAQEFAFGYEIGFSGRESLRFTERVLLPKRPQKEMPAPLFEAFAESIHIMLGISYYKLYCPPEIRLNFALSESQALFWETVYRKGLGEFAYRNNLDLRERIRFPRGGVASKPMDIEVGTKALVGIGGGKDSVVALELLKEQGIERDGFVIETYATHEIADSVCEIADIGSIQIKRTLDSQVFERLPGSYSGHIPISAVYAFLGTFAAALYGYRYVVTGNEFSSNFGNVEHYGEEVNHQWSKSAEFENLFNEYLRQFVTPSVRYFSIVRPFYEIRIAELFSKYPAYFPYFTSCNRKFLADRSRQPRGFWCCECPKCAFVYLMLAPFIEREELIQMFGRNLLDDQALLPLYKDILGFGTMKPFDCVGTFDEAQAALYMVRGTYADSATVQEFAAKVPDGATLSANVMRANQALSVPTQFRFAGMKSALILGYGAEGKASERFLKKEYPSLPLSIADEAADERYLDAQIGHDIALKTPGIPKRMVHMQYTTGTNIFFSRFPGKVIGVTGSKGKSTTASLIYHILANAGLPAKLVGNIGTPMLDILDESDHSTIAVAELSSYQLDDIEYSPTIAVATALFPEHMDYHEGKEAYYEAKRAIVRFQKSDDAFVFNQAFPELAEWAKETRGRALPFDELPFSPETIPLLGEHNASNVRAAITVARMFGIADADIEKAVRSFKGLPHRLEFVGEFKGIRFYDDAISTTPESTIAAVKAVPKVATIFLGGEDRGYDFSALEGALRAAGVENIVLFPESGQRMLTDTSGFNILETDNMKKAVAFAYKNTSPGAAVLLSCASPSYSLWKNFEEKGDEFQRLVRGG